LFRVLHLRALAAAILVLVCLTVAGCVAPLGRGYLIEKQQLEVHFLAGSDAGHPARVEIQAAYELRNTGDRPLSSLDARLPGGRRVQPSFLRANWDGSPAEIALAAGNEHNSTLTLPAPWLVSACHTLKISFEVASAGDAGPGLRFTGDAFFLPAADWSPELVPQSGLFGFGGTPPKSWELSVRVPQGFLVHTSGVKPKVSRSGSEQVLRVLQTPADRYPFVVAGRYTATEAPGGAQRMIFWTRSQQTADLTQAGQQLSRTVQAYDASFGPRFKTRAGLWIVECPQVQGCFSNAARTRSLLFATDAAEESHAEMISSDTVMVDLSGGDTALVASVAPSLAATWLGYGQNPGFYEQVPPLTAFPLFAAALGRQSVEGPAYRNEVIRRALSRIPRTEASKPERGKRPEEPPPVVRAKSFLFFYGLQDHYGADVFRRATTAMLDARGGRGFDISDLIASFDQESHQFTAAEFVRLWMKHPGVPDEFRARYENTASAAGSEQVPGSVRADPD